MPRKVWTFDPHSGGVPIPPALKDSLCARLEAYAAKNYSGKFERLEITFRGALCYINAYQEPDPPSPDFLAASGETVEEYFARRRSNPFRLGRLRHCGMERWSYAFYAYSNERYEPCLFPDGSWLGTPEDAFEMGAVYLQD